MKNTEKGFAIIVSLLVVAIMSAVATTAFFVSVSDLKISINRLQNKKSLRDAERVLAEAEMRIERCIAESGIDKCVGGIGDSVKRVTNAVSESGNKVSLSVTGRSGNFSAEIEAEYSVRDGKILMDSWRRRVEESQ